MPDYNVVQMKLNEVEILYVLLEYLPERYKKEDKIWKIISSHKGKLSSWHNLTVYCLMKDDGYLRQTGNSYITTKQGREQIMPLWNSRELIPYHPVPIACRLLKGILQILKWLIR